MENDSQKSGVTLLIVPGLLVVECASAPSEQNDVLFPSWGTEDPSVLATDEAFEETEFNAGENGSSRYAEQTQVPGVG